MQRLLKLVTQVLLLSLSLSSLSFATGSDTFNELILLKADIEKRHGVNTLECFPFIKNIGSGKDEEDLVKKCLRGAKQLALALDASTYYPPLRTVGISSRFLRTSGFQTMLIPWDAKIEDIKASIQDVPSHEKQNEFFGQIRTIKEGIQNRLQVHELYCTKTLNNKECLLGYQNLSKLKRDQIQNKRLTASIVLTDDPTPEKDFSEVRLRFDESADKMAKRMNAHDEYGFWSKRKKIYEVIEKKYGEAYRRKLQVPNVFCSIDLNDEECLKGAEKVFQLSQDKAMQDRLWGEIWINRYNTHIIDDHDVELNFNMPTDKLLSYYLKKPLKTSISKDITLSEKLEKKVKNNTLGLRAVCDLKGMTSELCAQALKDFISFLKKNRETVIPPPWTELMFVDGSKLDRVNFALNSSSRRTYIYVNAGSGVETLTDQLKHYQKK